MDYYSILGVNKNASQEDIKKAYRKLAAQHHPDRGGDTAKFQEIQAAFDVLGDPQKKQAYDNPRPQFEGFHGFGGMPPGFEEIFSQFAGGMFGGGGFRPPNRNRNLNLNATISLEESFHGKTLMANVTLPSGKEELIEVKIPPGVASGMTLRLAQMGDDTLKNAPRGDIFLQIQVKEHHKFMRQGDDLIIKLNIDCIDAMLGKTENIHTIENKNLEVHIKPGTQPGQILAINAHGMPKLNDARFRGRLLIEVNVTIPTMLTELEKEKIKKLL